MHDFKVIAVNGAKKHQIFLGKRYKIPKGATHARVRAGRISFGSSQENNSRKCKRGKFFKIPEGVYYISFNSYYNNKAGYNYGNPTWHNY